jgi:uncharacterized protein (DUF2235 family)
MYICMCIDCSLNRLDYQPEENRVVFIDSYSVQKAQYKVCLYDD